MFNGSCFNFFQLQPLTAFRHTRLHPIKTNETHSTDVELSSGLLAGLIFLTFNCACLIGFGVLNGNFIPGKYGYVCVTIYACYILVSFVLLFGAE